MKLSPQSQKLLALTVNEKQVLSHLPEDESMGVSDIARCAGLPRTTVGVTLRALKKRGLAARRKVQNHYEWQGAVPQDMRQRIFQLLSQTQTADDFVGAIESNDLSVEVYQGREQVIEAYKRAVRLSRGNRVRVLQTDKNAALVRSTLGVAQFRGQHQKLKEKKIVMETLNGEYIFELFENSSTADLQSHFGRPTVSYIVPDEYVTGDVDIVVMKNLALLVNVSTEKVTLVRSRAIKEALDKLITAAENDGWKVDLNAHIRRTLEARGVSVPTS